MVYVTRTERNEQRRNVSNRIRLVHPLLFLLISVLQKNEIEKVILS